MRVVIFFIFFTLITNNLALTYSLKYDNANKMRQCENIFVFIDLTKSIGSDLGGQFIRFSVLVEIKHKPINNIDETFYVQGTKQILKLMSLIFLF